MPINFVTFVVKSGVKWQESHNYLND